jgi:cytoskeletal protein CcmA (bactofilin family)
VIFSKRKADAPPSPVTPTDKDTNMARPSSTFTPTAVGPSRGPAFADRRTLVITAGITVQGAVQGAERLVVEGTIEAGAITGLQELQVAQGGIFKGEVEIEDAEIAGTVDGTLTARQTLIVRATGRVLGTARVRRLQVEDGGQIAGHIEVLTDTPTEG